MEKIGRYQIVGELGRGAMGVVYRAQDPTIGRTVAVKTIRLGAFTNDRERNELRKRLFREAQSAGILSHPGIVTIYDVAEEDDNAYVFMEFVNGPTLESMLESDNPPSREQILDILRQVAIALDYAHSQGIIHRDIKPANIMIHEGRFAKIADFGVAKIQSQQMTTGAIMGTPNYMSPEQISGAAIDGRADQFSLAVIVYELLTGEKPFSAETMPTLLFKIVKEEPVAPQRLNPSLSPRVDSVLQRSMAKNAGDRYPNCTAFIQDLEQAIAELPSWRPMAPGASLQEPTVAASAVRLEQAADGTPESTMIPVPVPVVETPPAPPPAPPPVVDEAPTVRTRRDSELEAEESASSPAKKSLIAVACLISLVGLYIVLKPYLPGASRGRPEAPVVAQKAPENPPAIDPNKPSAMPPVDAAPQPPAQPDPKPAAEPKPDEDTPPKVEQPKKGPVAKETPGGGVDSFELSTIPPGADVVFDGDPAKSCKTPCRIELTSGRHTLVAKTAGYRPQMRMFNFPNDGEIVLTLEQLVGKIFITSDPKDATITVDGQLRPERTPAALSLPAGNHQIVVSKDGHVPASESVSLRDGSLAKLELVLPAK